MEHRSLPKSRSTLNNLVLFLVNYCQFSLHYLQLKEQREWFSQFFLFWKKIVQIIWVFLKKLKWEKEHLLLNFHLIVLLLTTLMTVSIISAKNSDFDLLSEKWDTSLNFEQWKHTALIHPKIMRLFNYLFLNSI